jgi:CMP/dCMP kinase
MRKLSLVGGAHPRPNRYGRMIVTLSGPHGTGKSTYATKLATALRNRHVSAGGLFRKIAKERQLSLEELGELALADPSIDKLVDEKTLAEAQKGNVVLDGQLAGWVLRGKADLRIYLTAPENVRLERIAKRDKLSLEEATAQTKAREAVQSERYKRHYGFNVDDRSVYQLVLDTSIGSIEYISKVLLAAAIAVKDAKPQKKRSTKP